MSADRKTSRTIRIVGAVLITAFTIGAAGCMKQAVNPVNPAPQPVAPTEEILR